MSKKPTAERRLGFKSHVPLRKSKHSWESHADRGSFMKDVLHVLDLLAANDKVRRFVFAGLPAILKQCNNRRIKNKLKPCSLSHLKHVFAFLRDFHIISPYANGWDGRFGFIFEPHDARRSIKDGVCIKHLDYNRRAPYGDLGEPTDGTRCSTDVAPFVAPQAPFCSSARSTSRSTVDDGKPTDCTELTDEQVAEWMAKNVPDAAPKVSKVSKVSRLEGLKAIEVSNQEQGQPKDQSLKSISSSRLTDQKQEPASMRIKGETIGNHFVLGATIELITDGEFDTKASDWRKDEWQLFLECMQQAVDAKEAYSFSGRETCAQLMGDSMKLLRDGQGKQAPKGWLPTMRHLRATPGPTITKSGAVEIANGQKMVDKSVEEMAAEIMKRTPCPGCGARHLPPYCGEPPKNNRGNASLTKMGHSAK
jgi:hypothetical protein